MRCWKGGVLEEHLGSSTLLPPYLALYIASIWMFPCCIFNLLLLLFRCSVTSDPLWTYGLQPARLLCPWDYPGKNNGVGCHFLFQGIFLTQWANCISCKSPALQAKSLPLSRQASNIFTDCSIWVWWLEPVLVVEWNIVLFSICKTFSGFNWSCLIIVVIELSTILCGNYSSSSSLQPIE